jgi:hypothetical protein
MSVPRLYHIHSAVFGFADPCVVPALQGAQSWYLLSYSDHSQVVKVGVRHPLIVRIRRLRRHHRES